MSCSCWHWLWVCGIWKVAIHCLLVVVYVRFQMLGSELSFYCNDCVIKINFCLKAFVTYGSMRACKATYLRKFGVLLICCRSCNVQTIYGNRLFNNKVFIFAWQRLELLRLSNLPVTILQNKLPVVTDYQSVSRSGYPKHHVLVDGIQQKSEKLPRFCYWWK